MEEEKITKDEEAPAKKKTTSTGKKASTRKKKVTTQEVKVEETTETIKEAIPETKEEAIPETVEEVKEDITEETKADEEVTEVDENQDTTVVSETPKPKNKVSALTIVLALICATLAIILLVSKFGSTTVKLDNFNECFADKSASIKLPNSYLFSQDGTIYQNNNGILEPKAIFFASESNEEDYQYLSDMIVEQYAGEASTRGDFKLTTITQESEDETYKVFCLYKDGIIAEFQFINVDQKDISSIIDSFTY